MVFINEEDRSPDEEARHNMVTAQKLPWLANPVLAVEKPKTVDPREFDELQQDIEGSRTVYSLGEIPRFEKNGKSSNLEIFYDLWFVANLAIFTTLHTVNNTANLYSYIGYISILWFDWFLVSIYDVRYLADSVFERVARVVHMGVMVGFAVVSVNFSPENQDKTTFQVTSLVLMVSRLVLAGRYLSILFHIRHFKQGKAPFLILVAANLIAAFIYLGVSFRFTGGKNSRGFVTWYVVGGIEVLLQLGLSLYFQVLSFNDTYLTDRMRVSTMFMLAEGVNVLAENVVTIVSNHGWTSATIGNLTAGITVIYFVFMIYFDWSANHHHLGGIRQALWTLLHFPFHVLLLLSNEGATQFVQWWKIAESVTYVDKQLNKSINHYSAKLSEVPMELATSTVVDTLRKTVDEIWARYQPTYALTYDSIEVTLTGIKDTIPNELWYDSDYPDRSTLEDKYLDYVFDLLTTVSNSIFQNYKIDPTENVLKHVTPDATETDIQYASFEATFSRLYITFEFTFIATGLTLILMVIMFSVARGGKKAWSWSVGVRMALFALAGLALALSTLVARDYNSDYPLSPWLLPTLSLVWFSVLVLTHFPRRPPAEAFLFWRRARRGKMGNNHHHVDTRYEHVRNEQVTGYQGAGGDQMGYGGQPTHYSSKPDEEIETGYNKAS